MAQKEIREVAGIFLDKDQLQGAIDELLIHEFDRRHISVMGNEKAVEDVFNKPHVDPKKAMKDPETPRAPLIDEDEVAVAQGAVMSGGLLTGVATSVLATGAIAMPGAAITAIIIGGLGGTAAGAVLAKIMGDRYKDHFEKQIDAGGLLLWVRTPTQDLEKRAIDLLKKSGGKNVQAYSIEASDEPEQI